MSSTDRGTFADLCEIMRKLRSPAGCPWDREQTHSSLVPYLIEEAYETIDAIERESDPGMREELGDLLLQVVFHAQLAEERGAFTITDVLKSLRAKLIHRHPHVFAGSPMPSSSEVSRNWANIKASERSTGTVPLSTVHGVPRALPALVGAHRIGEKAGSVGFDWPTASAVRRKIDEELAEADRAAERNDDVELGMEIGDLLFAVASYARHCGFHAETLLRAALDRFVERFGAMERELASRGRAVCEASTRDLDAAWIRAKAAVSRR